MLWGSDAGQTQKGIQSFGDLYLLFVPPLILAMPLFVAPRLHLCLPSSSRSENAEISDQEGSASLADATIIWVDRRREYDVLQSTCEGVFA